MEYSGTGIYGIPEVARYTRVHPNTIRSWLKSMGNRDGVFAGMYKPTEGHYAIDFLEMIDVLVVGELRSCGVSLRTIRAAHSILKRDLRTTHPFSHISIYTDGRAVLTDAAAGIGDETLVEVVSKQGHFPKRMQPKLRQIEYGKNKLASRWNIARGIVLDPRLCLGKPAIQDTAIASYVLSKQFFANDEDKALVAHLYGVSERSILDAVKFEAEYAQAA